MQVVYAHAFFTTGNLRLDSCGQIIREFFWHASPLLARIYLYAPKGYAYWRVLSNYAPFYGALNQYRANKYALSRTARFSIKGSICRLKIKPSVRVVEGIHFANSGYSVKTVVTPLDLDTIDRLCKLFDCKVGDLFEFRPDN